VLLGDATKICACFQYFDVVTLIEVIEHLHQHDLYNLVEHVFGQIRPRLVIVTTPNADFNVLFSTMINGQFRHSDHKFEFTRKEFSSWSEQITRNFNYQVEYHGVGDAPLYAQDRQIGPCTQIAIFKRNIIEDRAQLVSSEFSQRLSRCCSHELVQFIDYPYGISKVCQTHEQIRYILDMFRLTAIERARLGDNDDQQCYGTRPLTIARQTLLSHPRLTNLKITTEQLKRIIDSTGYRMFDDDHVILSDDSSIVTNDDYDNNNESSPICSYDSIEFQQQSHPSEECWD
jgi:hypothetical protein